MTRQQHNQVLADRLFWLGEIVQKLNGMGVAVSGIDGALSDAPIVRVRPGREVERLGLECMGHSGGLEGLVDHYVATFNGAQVRCSVNGPSLLLRQVDS
ncbi:MAG: hypothetical protein EPN21_07915 [Methylococcaceae bacterium]|nr:MAG: hypothetical protein EPN21_07915 [Methylococcaceae bacterium]